MKYNYGGVDYEGDDFYQYPDSDVLMNKFNIRDYDKLQDIERKLSYANMIHLGETPIKGTLDLKYLQKIHKAIFGDIYSWAGRIRGGKFFFKGEAQFCNADMIQTYSDTITEKLRKENWLRGLCRDDFIRRTAYFMGEINTLHPFREGNGRTQRIFFTELARRAKYELNFSEAQPDELLEADIAAYDKDFAPLAALLDRMLT
jgi:cell filamentation protein